MNDLISRSALIEWGNASEIRKAVGNWHELDNKAKTAVLRYAQSLKRAILAAPAVDAMPVVRCGECSKRHTLQCALYVGQYSEDGESVKMVFVTKPDDFWCKYGERRTDES